MSCAVGCPPNHFSLVQPFFLMKMARGVWPFNLSGTPTTAQSTTSS